jgi:hypothetical protein
MTAIEWLVEQFEQSHSYINEIFKETIEQAKEMEKHQIMNAYCDGEHQQGFQNESEQYYDKTYKNK